MLMLMLMLMCRLTFHRRWCSLHAKVAGKVPSGFYIVMLPMIKTKQQIKSKSVEFRKKNAMGNSHSMTQAKSTYQEQIVRFGAHTLASQRCGFYEKKDVKFGVDVWCGGSYPLGGPPKQRSAAVSFSKR